MEQLRVVETPGGEIFYLLTKKQVKNMNLRIDPAGQICLSVPRRCPPQRADEFIRDKWSWLLTHLNRRTSPKAVLPPLPNRQQCLVLLTDAVKRVYPLVASYGVAMPQVRIRTMRSQWGNCHWVQGYITLNVALCCVPEPLREYVALHELVHFLHHDHQRGFYAVMDHLMPDWKQRRRQLKSNAMALKS